MPLNGIIGLTSPYVFIYEIWVLTQRAVYLDHNATHPLLPAVRARLSEALESEDAQILNPSSVHRHGQQAKALMSRLRNLLGAVAGRADGEEWVFTSGATESINTVLKGFVADRISVGRRPVIVTTSAEHSAVTETLPHLSAATCVLINVDRSGKLDFLQLATELDALLADPKNDVLVSLLLLNNETGVLLDSQALREVLAKVFLKYEPAQWTTGSSKFFVASEAKRLWLHLDAAQALGKLEPRKLRLAWFDADYVSVSAHKMGASPGIGALWLRPSVPFSPLMTGGVQEKKRRAGTFNSLAAFTWVAALEDWAKNGDQYRSHMNKLRRTLHDELKNSVPGYVVHGESADGDLPEAVNTLNFHVEGCDEESLVMALDVEGFSVSSGSACNSGSLKPSHVLRAMGYSDAVALSSVRLSVGVGTTEAEIKLFAQALKTIVNRIVEGKKYWASILPEVKVSAQVGKGGQNAL